MHFGGERELSQQWSYQRFVSSKVKNILEDSLDLIPSPSPSVKIQIMGGKSGLSKHCWALSIIFFVQEIEIE